MFFLCYYTQINPKINPYGIKFVTKGAVCNTLRPDVGDWHRFLCYINF